MLEIILFAFLMAIGWKTGLSVFDNFTSNRCGGRRRRR